MVPVPHHNGSVVQPPAEDSVQTEAEGDAKSLSTEIRAEAPNNKGPLLKHINFWHEDELKMAHPEVQASFALWLAPQSKIQ